MLCPSAPGLAPEAVVEVVEELLGLSEGESGLGNLAVKSSTGEEGGVLKQESGRNVSWDNVSLSMSGWLDSSMTLSRRLRGPRGLLMSESEAESMVSAGILEAAGVLGLAVFMATPTQ